MKEYHKSLQAYEQGERRLGGFRVKNSQKQLINYVDR